MYSSSIGCRARNPSRNSPSPPAPPSTSSASLSSSAMVAVASATRPAPAQGRVPIRSRSAIDDPASRRASSSAVPPTPPPLLFSLPGSVRMLRWYCGLPNDANQQGPRSRSGAARRGWGNGMRPRRGPKRMIEWKDSVLQARNSRVLVRRRRAPQGSRTNAGHLRSTGWVRYI